MGALPQSRTGPEAPRPGAALGGAHPCNTRTTGPASLVPACWGARATRACLGLGWPWSPSVPAFRVPWVPGAVSQDLVDGCQRSVREHGTYSRELLELRQWIATVTQKLQSHQRDTGPWDAQSQEAELEVRRLSLQGPAPPKAGLRGRSSHTGEQGPRPRPTGVLGVSCRGCWLTSRRRRPSCP